MRASQLLPVIAAVIATGASAGSVAPVVQKPMLRTSAATASVTKPSVQQPVLRASTNVGVAKVVVHKVVVHQALVSRRRLVVRHFAVRRGSPSIAVPLDEVRVVAFSQPISTIYVGNPMIADVSMIDARHAFILGKGFGLTNIVALNADGKQVVNDPVNVFGHSGSTVILHRGAAQTTYACAGARCESAPMPGDDKDAFSTRMDQMNAHQDAGVKAASAH